LILAHASYKFPAVGGGIVKQKTRFLTQRYDDHR